MSPPLPSLIGTLEEWYPLAKDPGLHAGGVEIGARATIKPNGAPELRIVFRRGKSEAYVTCVHVAVYAGPLESLPPEAELARSSEHRKIQLAPEEHFFALKSFVAGVAEVGIGTMFAVAREAGDLPVGFNVLMQAQFLRALFEIAPTETQNFCLWALDDATQAAGTSRQTLDYLIPLKKIVATNKDAPIEILARLAEDADSDVQGGVGSNIKWLNCAPAILASLAEDADKSVRIAVAKHQNTPPEALSILARDTDKSVRLAVAKHQNISPETLTNLAGDTDINVRRAVALHKHTPSNVLVNLARDAELTVRGGVACNERTPSEVLAHLAKSCPICKILGVKMHVDFTTNGHFPEEVWRLDKVMWFHDWHDLKRCPLCSTYYDFTYFVDNDPYSPPMEDWAEYEQIPAEKAEQMINDENFRIKTQQQGYKRQVHRLHGKVIKTLPEEEKRIVAYLTPRLYQSTDVGEIEKNVGLDTVTVKKALVHLMQVNIVSESGSETNRRYSLSSIRM